MNSIEESIGMMNKDGETMDTGHGDQCTIYTHSARTRTIIMLLFISYFTFFFLFVRFLQGQFQKMQNLPPLLAALDDAEMAQFFFFVFAGLGLLVGLLILGYFAWAVADIWGLQVMTSERELRVQNTVTGNLWGKYTGVGRLKFEDIEALKGSGFATYVFSDSAKLRFSPVDQLDALINEIMVKAKRAKIDM